MTKITNVIPPRIDKVLNTAKHFTVNERLTLAKLLLDSVLNSDTEDEVDWRNISLASFQQDWDNPEDAIYDNWRELYGV
jgi:hypothetical protein